MSVKAQKAVSAFLMSGGASGRGLSVGEVSLLRLVGWFASESDGRAWPNRKTLALMSGLSVRQVTRVMNRLAGLGVVLREVRKTHDGDGWYYTIGDLPVGEMVSPSKNASRGHLRHSVGDICDTSRGHLRHSVGDMVSPDIKEKFTDTYCVCESAGASAPKSPAHTQDISCPSLSPASPAPASPFGIYPVEAAVASLSGGDDPVPRRFVEDRARSLTECGGRTDRGVEVRPDGFAAHVRKWWTHERNRRAFLAHDEKAISEKTIQDSEAKYVTF